MTLPVLWYFADPMCSWCWGFTPVIEQIRQDYQNRVPLALVLGGLRPGTQETVTPAFREKSLHHWRAVQQKTGQIFTFENVLPEGFIYNTEIPSRAVISLGKLKPEATFAYFKSIQSAFYTGQQDVTQSATLAELSAIQGVDAQTFLETFQSDEAKNLTQSHFNRAREWGVRGFPTLIFQTPTAYHLLTNGYRPFNELKSQIDALLEST